MNQFIRKFTPFVWHLFFLTAIILAVLAAGTLIRINEDRGMAAVYTLYAVLMFGDAIAMLVCGLYINRQIRLIYWFAVVVLGLNIVLTIFDQFGLIDLLFLLLNLLTLALLLASRRHFLPQ